MVKKISKISLFVLAQLTNATDGRTDRRTPHAGNSRAMHSIARQKLTVNLTSDRTRRRVCQIMTRSSTRPHSDSWAFCISDGWFKQNSAQTMASAWVCDKVGLILWTVMLFTAIQRYVRNFLSSLDLHAWKRKWWRATLTSAKNPSIIGCWEHANQEMYT